MSEQWLPSASDQEDILAPTVEELQETITQQAQEILQYKFDITRLEELVTHLKAELEEYRSIAQGLGINKA